MRVQVSHLLTVNLTKHVLFPTLTRLLLLNLFFFALFTFVREPSWPKAIWDYIQVSLVKRVCSVEAWENIWGKNCCHKSLMTLLSFSYLLHKILIYHESVVCFLKYSMWGLSWAGFWKAIHGKNLSSNSLHIHISQDVLHLIFSNVMIWPTSNNLPDLLVYYMSYCSKYLFKHH